MAVSLRHLPKPPARVLHRKAPAVWTRTAAQDSSGAGTKKRTPVGHHPFGYKNQKDQREFENLYLVFVSKVALEI